MATEKTAKLTALKNENRRLILGCVKGDISCSDISRMTGLSYTCVVSLVDELIEEGILIKTDAAVTVSVGRRPIWVKFRPRRNILCAVGFTTRYGFRLFDFDGTVLYSRPNPFGDPPIATEKIERFADDIAEVLREQFADCRLHNISIAVPGRFDKTTGEMVYAPSFAEKINFVKYFGERFGVPVFLKNDLKFSLLAEKSLGEHKNSIEDTLFVQLGGNGVGCALYLNGSLYEGANGLSGEIGHFIVDYSNGLSALGKGEKNRLFFQKCSSAQMIFAAETLMKEGMESCLAGKPVTEEAIAEGYAAGDPLCTEIVDGTIMLASDVIRSLSEVLDFNNVIVSKRTEMYGPSYLEKLKNYVNRGPDLYPIDVMSASFGDEGIMLGLFAFGLENALDAISVE